MLRFIVMDVDGTLTDGKIYMGQQGESFKAFDVKDGCGIKDILPQINVIPIIITARYSNILKRRCDELGIKYVFQGVHNKLKKLNQFLVEKSKVDNCDYSLSQVAYIGDDILDLQCMIPIKSAGGIVGCPYDATKAVREFIEHLRNIGLERN